MQMPLWILQPHLKLVPDLSLDTRIHHLHMGCQELANGFRVMDDERPERPGMGFDDHVLMVLNEHLADGQGPPGITFPNIRSNVQGDRADQGSPPLPQLL